MKTLHILLAEDNRGDILLVRQALKEHGIPHELHVVKDGEQALGFVARMGRTVEEPCPDVLLLDLNLPRADGAQVLRTFREHPACTQTPVVVISSSDAPRELAQMSELGISHYFRKPLDLDAFMQLGAVVKKVMEK